MFRSWNPIVTRTSARALISGLVLILGLLGKTSVALADPSPPPLQAGDLQIVGGDIAAVKSDLAPQVAAAVAATNYDALELLAGNLRRSGAQTADGTWHLLIFYQVLTYDRPDGIRMGDHAWQARLAFLRGWMNAWPKSITARVALARFYENYAWQARGTGDAGTVTADGQRLFDDRIGRALKILVEAKLLTATCPVWWDTMQGVELSRGANLNDSQQLANAAVTNETRYAGFYLNHATYLLPRNFGDEGDWENFATRSADAVGGDDGDVLYARIGWCIHRQHVYDNFLKDTGYSWPRLKNGFTLILQRYPDSGSATNELACLAYLAGDKDCAKPLCAHLGPVMDSSVWGDNRKSFLLVRNWALDQ